MLHFALLFLNYPSQHGFIDSALSFLNYISQHALINSAFRTLKLCQLNFFSLFFFPFEIYCFILSSKFLLYVAEATLVHSMTYPSITCSQEAEKHARVFWIMVQSWKLTPSEEIGPCRRASAEWIWEVQVYIEAFYIH